MLLPWRPIGRNMPCTLCLCTTSTCRAAACDMQLLSCRAITVQPTLPCLQATLHPSPTQCSTASACMHARHRCHTGDDATGRGACQVCALLDSCLLTVPVLYCTQQLITKTYTRGPTHTG